MATLSAMFRLFDGYSSTIDKITRKTYEATDRILRASGSTDNFNRKLNNTGASANSASSGMGRLVKTFISLAAIQKGMSITDEYTNTNARLSLINDGLQTQAELQEKIFQSANRSRGAYTNMAGAISKMGLLAGESFGSNDELIAFTELIQKSFKVGGASSSEQSSAMLQLSQAMAAGKLQGDEFRSIMENAPMIAEAIALYTGKSKGELKEMSSEGLITSDIIKNAMFAMGDDINAKFETMPMTFSDAWNKIKNGAVGAFSEVMGSVTKTLNTDTFDTFINGLITGFYFLAQVLGSTINLIVSFASFFIDNWGIIAPIIYGVVAALVVYNATMGIAWLTTLKQVAAKAAHTLASWAETTAILALIVAQDGFNAALLACPISWIIIAVIALIALFYVAVGAINKLAGTSISATGIIAGVFMWLLALMGNQFVAVFNLILDGVSVLWNAFATFAEFFANVFNDPVGSIIRLFGGLADTVLEILQGIASAIDTIFNSNLSAAVSGWRGSLKGMVKEIAGEAKIEIPRMDASSLHLKRFNNGEAYNLGYNFGSNLEDKFSMDSILSNIPGIGTGAGFDISDFGTSSNPLAVEGTGKGGSIDVNMADEDLKYLRDIAERDYINKFSTATLAPTIQISFGDVHKEADVDKVTTRIKKILQEEISIAAEGVY